jgi:DNA-binding IclR family transcriptional regulator
MSAFEKARYIWHMVAIFPGETAYSLARLLGLSDGQVASTLCSMERHGFLVYEDDDGGLHTFGIVVGH